MPGRIQSFKPTLHARAKPPINSSKKERDAFYSSAEWMACRADFLAANPLCVRCTSEAKIEEATHAHHIIERLVRPDLAFSHANLEALCASHHSKEHANRRKQR